MEAKLAIKKFCAAVIAAFCRTRVLGRKAAGCRASCERLGSSGVPNAKITLGEAGVAGSFTPTTAVNAVDGQRHGALRTLPPFAEWRLKARPSGIRTIKIEGLAADRGVEWKISRARERGIRGRDPISRAGVAIHEVMPRGTDTAMRGRTDARWALGHPEKSRTFGYREIHEMTQNAKT